MPSDAEKTRKYFRQKTLKESVLSAALLMATGDELGGNPIDTPKASEVSTPGKRKFRIVDRDAPFRQSLGNVLIQRINRDEELFLLDPFHILVEMRTWRLLVSFWSLYAFTFSLFATIYWLASERCGIGCDTFPEALLLSVETMLTIGYGVPDPYFKPCPWLVVVLILQCLVAVLYDVVFVGALYQRVSSGIARASTILFSDKAVIQALDGGIYLMFRVCEMQKTQLLDCHVRCYLFTRELEQESSADRGQFPRVKFRQDPMRLERPDDSMGAPMMLILPTKVMHRVDTFSPLLGPRGRALLGDYAPQQRSSDAEAGCRDGAWCSVCGSTYAGHLQLRRHAEFTAEQEARDCPGREAPHAALLHELQEGLPAGAIRTLLTDRMETCDLEVVCILEGVDAVSSSSVQVRHSWTVDDMVWDHDFAPCTSITAGGQVKIDFSKFHDLVPCA